MLIKPVALPKMRQSVWDLGLVVGNEATFANFGLNYSSEAWADSSVNFVSSAGDGFDLPLWAVKNNLIDPSYACEPLVLTSNLSGGGTETVELLNAGITVAGHDKLFMNIKASESLNISGLAGSDITIEWVEDDGLGGYIYTLWTGGPTTLVPNTWTQVCIPVVFGSVIFQGMRFTRTVLGASKPNSYTMKVFWGELCTEAAGMSVPEIKEGGERYGFAIGRRTTQTHETYPVAPFNTMYGSMLTKEKYEGDYYYIDYTNKILYSNMNQTSMWFMYETE